MFSSIKLLKRALDNSNNIYDICYLLEDTDFVLKLNIPIPKDMYENRLEASIIPSGLIHAYKKMNGNIPKNIAMFYMKTLIDASEATRVRFINLDMLWTEQNFPELEYKNKYIKCVFNQLKVIEYTWRNKSAKSII